jgi:eukaryotic-like serine/threonine-protein kinase
MPRPDAQPPRRLQPRQPRPEVPHHVEGPVASAGDVVQSGEYVAGHDLTIDQSVHATSLLTLGFRRRQPPPNPFELRRARRQLLAEVRRTWIQGVLEDSLDEVARIELGLAERPGAVEHPWGATVVRPDQPDRPLPRDTPISQVYDELGGRLLILGAPGAGKTTLLLELTRELLERGDGDIAEPMPVVFHLGSWAAERRPLAAWLVGELHKRYGVARRLGQFWVEHDAVAPLLDGLDEVAAEHRAACVAAINVFRDLHGQLPLVVCSRVADYEALGTKLRLHRAVVITPLTRASVRRYLEQGGRRLAGVRAALRDDEQLWELLTTPLLLSVVALTYKDKPATAVRASGTIGDRRRLLWEAYVQEMLTRRGVPSHSGQARYSRQQTICWLGWLARTMRRHDQSVFYLEWMQPDWLPTRAQQRLGPTVVAVAAGLFIGLLGQLVYRWGAAVLFIGLVVGQLAHQRLTIGPAQRSRWSWPMLGRSLAIVLLCGLLIGLQRGVPTRADQMLAGLVIGLLTGLLAYEATIEPAERLRWSWTTFRRSWAFVFPVGLCMGLIVGLIGQFIGILNRLRGGQNEALIAGVLDEVRENLHNDLTIVLIIGIVVGLVASLFAGLEIELNVRPTAPNQGMRTSVRSALLSGLLVGLLLGLISAVLQTRLSVGVLVGCFAGVFTGLLNGGGAYLRHLVMRALLVRNGIAPWNYVAFLDYAADRILLRKAGGGFLFVHRMLLEYFTVLEPIESRMRLSERASTLEPGTGPQ